MFRISDLEIQQRLFAERTLTFTKALEIAQGLETADKNMRELTKGVSHEASQATLMHQVSPLEVGEVLLEAAAVRLPLNVFVVEKSGTLIQIVVFEILHVTSMARLGFWQKFAGAQRWTTGNLLERKLSTTMCGFVVILSKL